RVTALTLTLGLVLLSAGLLHADAIADHQAMVRPLQMGTSGGNIKDRSTMWCCSGTLGALVTDGSVQYVLSNNHVLARTNDGIVTKGTVLGDAIIQPGLIDEAPVCAQDATDTVANLSRFVPISFKKGTTNDVDAAIAQLFVTSDGSILGVGAVSAT